MISCQSDTRILSSSNPRKPRSPQSKNAGFPKPNKYPGISVSFLQKAAVSVLPAIRTSRIPEKEAIQNVVSSSGDPWLISRMHISISAPLLYLSMPLSQGIYPERVLHKPSPGRPLPPGSPYPANRVLFPILSVLVFVCGHADESTLPEYHVRVLLNPCAMLVQSEKIKPQQ